MNACRQLVVFAALCLALASRADTGVGDLREDVLRQHGFPTSVAKRGDREVLFYPKGGRVELTNGKVSDLRGPLPPAPTTPPPSPETASGPATASAPKSKQGEAVKPAAPAPKTVAATPTTPPPPPKTPPPLAPSQPAPYDAGAATAALASQVEKMDSGWGAAPPPPPEKSALVSILSFLAGLLLRFGVTIAALKLAFKYWEMDAFWKGILAIAGIDLALHAILQLLGPVTGGLTTMSAVENGLPGVVLIYTINRFCFNKRLNNAVATAAAVKLVVTLLYIFVGLTLLNLAFG